MASDICVGRVTARKLSRRQSPIRILIPEQHIMPSAVSDAQTRHSTAFPLCRMTWFMEPGPPIGYMPSKSLQSAGLPGMSYLDVT